MREIIWIFPILFIVHDMEEMLIWLLVISINTLSYTNGQVLVYGLIGIVLIAGNLKVAHLIMHAFTEKMIK